MKKENPEIEQKMCKEESSESGELTKAIERIHKRYGNDLNAFFRDIKDSIRKQNAKNEKSESYVL